MITRISQNIDNFHHSEFCSLPLGMFENTTNSYLTTAQVVKLTSWITSLISAQPHTHYGPVLSMTFGLYTNTHIMVLVREMCHIRQWSHWGSLFLHHRIAEYCSMHRFSPSWRSLKHIFWEYWGEAVCHLKICFLGYYFMLVILRNKRFRNFDLPIYLPKGIQIEKPAWRRGAILLA